MQEGDKHLNIFEKKQEFFAETSTLNELLDASEAPNMIDFFSLDIDSYDFDYKYEKSIKQHSLEAGRMSTEPLTTKLKHIRKVENFR